MKEDDLATNESTPSNQQLEGQSYQNPTKIPKETKAEAYKLHKWRKQAKTTSIR